MQTLHLKETVPNLLEQTLLNVLREKYGENCVMDYTRNNQAKLSNAMYNNNSNSYENRLLAQEYMRITNEDKMNGTDIHVKTKDFELRIDATCKFSNKDYMPYYIPSHISINNDAKDNVHLGLRITNQFNEKHNKNKINKKNDKKLKTEAKLFDEPVIVIGLDLRKLSNFYNKTDKKWVEVDDYKAMQRDIENALKNSIDYLIEQSVKAIDQFKNPKKYKQSECILRENKFSKGSIAERKEKFRVANSLQPDTTDVSRSNQNKNY